METRSLKSVCWQDHFPSEGSRGGCLPSLPPPASGGSRCSLACGSIHPAPPLSSDGCLPLCLYPNVPLLMRTPVMLDSYGLLTWVILQRPYVQKRSYSQVWEYNNSDLFSGRGHNSNSLVPFLHLYPPFLCTSTQTNLLFISSCKLNPTSPSGDAPSPGGGS